MIMSYVCRKLKKYSINLLEVFAFNNYYLYISFIIFILTWLNLFNFATVYINSFIVYSWVAACWYQTYKLTKENQLLKLINSSLTKYKTEDVREGLAALMHDIWVQDIFQTNLTLDEQYRANTHYVDLSHDDKQVNLTKADKVLELLNSYKKD